MEPVLFAEWYTDPFCSWSYAAEGALDKFRKHFGSRLSFRHRLLPLYKDLGPFLAHHGFSNQAEFAPRVLKVSKVTGIPMSPRVWELGRAPTSTEECCLFAKAALIADPAQGDLLLSRMRVLAFVEGEAIGDRELLLREAKRLGLDTKRLEELERSPAVSAALQEDVDRAREEGVTTRPTLVLGNAGGDRVFIGGLRNAELFILAGETLVAEDA